MAVERWTPERRRQHTRDLLLDAAQDVFARRGFEGASLEDIAEVAGFTRGAIYKHFANKAELFLAVNERFNERALIAFADMLEHDLAGDENAALARKWREVLAPERDLLALGMEFNLYVLRHPEMRAQVAEHRRRLPGMIAAFMEQRAATTGITLRLPAITIARVILAASDGLAFSAEFDDDDLYEPFLELLNAALPAD
ncbi:MAG: TetR family transcriptional regulator [Acidimicrobiales bacterium]|jgi:AcrR family transcriptional regulator|nr:TetR family transcriptional regulator [Acidimicrobiales bacterium]